MTVRKFQNATKEEKLNFLIWLIVRQNFLDINSKEGWMITKSSEGDSYEVMTGTGKFCYKITDKNMCKQLFAAQCYRYALDKVWFKRTVGGC